MSEPEQDKSKAKGNPKISKSKDGNIDVLKEMVTADSEEVSE